MIKYFPAEDMKEFEKYGNQIPELTEGEQERAWKIFQDKIQEYEGRFY